MGSNTCPSCHGRGYQEVQMTKPNGEKFLQRVTCGKCNGSGTV